MAEPTDAQAVRLPRRQRGPVRRIGRRVGYAVTAIVAMVAVVLLDRAGYRDNIDGHVSALDAVYYATVSLSPPGTATSCR